MYCSTCRLDFRDDLSICPKCGSSLRERARSVLAEMQADDPQGKTCTHEVFRTPEPLEAGALLEILEEAGIRAAVLSSLDAERRPDAPVAARGAPGQQWLVLVPPSFSTEAKTIIARLP